jgi:hypothetical protein
MTTVLEKCTAEEQRSVVRFSTEGLNLKDIHKEVFPVYVVKFLSFNRFRVGSRHFLKDVRKFLMIPDQVDLLRLREKQLCSG